MMKCILWLFFFLGISNIRAENDEPLKWNVSIGIGAPNPVRYISFIGIDKVANNYKAVGSVPFHLKGEYKVKWWMGLGLNINHISYKSTFTHKFINTNGDKVDNQITVTNNSTAFNLHANFHFLNPKNYTKSDFYWGLGMGYKAGKFKVSTQYEEDRYSVTLPSIIKFGFETTFGYRYFFTENLAAYTELGLAKSFVQIGITAAF